MKKFIVSFFVFLLTLVGLQAADFLIQATYIRGPIKSSPDFAWWSSNAVSRAYRDRSFGAFSIGTRLQPDMVAQSIQVEDRSGNTLWLATRITGVGGKKFSLHQLNFNQTSFEEISGMENRNSLGNSYSPGEQNAVYGPNCLGIVWSNGQPRQDDTILPSLTSGNTLVDEVVFVGMQTKFFVFDFNDPNGQKGIEDYIKSSVWQGGFRLQGTVGVKEGDQMFSASRTLSLNPTEMIQIVFGRHEGHISLGANAPSGNTFMVQSSRNNWDWTNFINIDSGQQINIDSSSLPYQFFRIMVE